MDFHKTIEGALDESGIAETDNTLILLREPNTDNADFFWISRAFLKAPEERNRDERIYCEYLEAVLNALRGKDAWRQCYYMNLNPNFGEGSASDYYRKRIIPALKLYRKSRESGIDSEQRACIAEARIDQRMGIIEDYVRQGKINAIITVNDIYAILRAKDAPEVCKRQGSHTYRRSVTRLFGKEITLYRIYHPAYYRRNPKIKDILEKGWEDYV